VWVIHEVNIHTHAAIAIRIHRLTGLLTFLFSVSIILSLSANVSNAVKNKNFNPTLLLLLVLIWKTGGHSWTIKLAFIF
jgi:hypothetical protein